MIDRAASLWTIEPVMTATFLSPGPEVFFQRDFTRRVEMALFTFVLRGAGACVILDTGLADHAALDRDVRLRKGEWAGFHDHGTAARQRIADDVTDIVLTSLGPYGVGRLNDSPGATVHVSARGLSDAREPECFALPRRVAPEALARLAGPRVNRVTGTSTPHAGLTIVQLGGHSPSAMGVVVDTAQGRIAIADPIFHGENLTRGLPLGWCESLPDWFAVFEPTRPRGRDRPNPRPFRCRGFARPMASPSRRAGGLMAMKAGRDAGPVLVTGAAGDIGVAVVRRLLADGRRVIGSDIAQHPASFADLPWIAADLSAASGWTALADGMGGPLSGFVHVAGIVLTQGLDEIAESDWDRCFAVHVKAPFVLLRALRDRLPASSSVVLVGTVAARRASPENLVYGATKAALASMAASMAVALAASGVRVNVVAPGLIDTALTDVPPSA